MITPNADRHNSDPNYIRELLKRAGLTQRGAAKRLGINERTMRYYLSGQQKIPYVTQYCLEALAFTKK